MIFPVAYPCAPREIPCANPCALRIGRLKFFPFFIPGFLPVSFTITFFPCCFIFFCPVWTLSGPRSSASCLPGACQGLALNLARPCARPCASLRALAWRPLSVCLDPVCLEPDCLDSVCLEPVFLDPVCLDHVCQDPVYLVSLCQDPVYLDPVCLDPVCLDLVCLEPVCLDLVCLDPVLSGPFTSSLTLDESLMRIF